VVKNCLFVTTASLRAIAALRIALAGIETSSWSAWHCANNWRSFVARIEAFADLTDCSGCACDTVAWVEECGGAGAAGHGRTVASKGSGDVRAVARSNDGACRRRIDADLRALIRQMITENSLEALRGSTAGC
jgi:hypothetical protein